MNKMAEQLRETYTDMETEDLLSLRANGTLTETATSVLNEVLSTRNISDNTIAAVETEVNQRLHEEYAIRTSLASIPKRFGAQFIDVIGVLLLVGIVINIYQLFYPADRDGFSTLLGMIFMLYLLFKDGFGGQSIGKRATNIRVIRIRDGKPCSFLGSFVRNLVGCLGLFDWIFALGSQQRRLGDLVAGTRVVKAL
jgi:uncharacterized RDD family membrane protein YckC